MSKELQQEALKYHEGGKIGTHIKVPVASSKDLSLAYSPGVAEPCKVIAEDAGLAYKYTNKSNLVAVISNGTAVLGLGNIGALASKPVMEGKAVLFKKFAGVDAVDIEIDETDPAKIVEICRAIAPSFGGINLEDIKAPECFEIEPALQEAVDIPVMHDDQHGTAIITTAGLLNAAQIAGKNIPDMKIVVSGAGAAGIACAKMYKSVGAKNIIMVDSRGVVHSGRDDLNEQKREFAITTNERTLADALKDADMFLGLSRPGLVTKEMIASMKPYPIVFALANPVPEIYPDEVLSVRPHAMVGTGRSDFNNQVNNVLCFPFIFRGALDVRAKKITENMKKAAAEALAALAKEPVPDDVLLASGVSELKFGQHYIIPKPFDRRAFVWVSLAVAKAAVKDGVARVSEFDEQAYKSKLEKEANL
ncbi:malic enzyme-like NAD(P)-binding protein [Campylobacter sp. 19-13652]|uniref:malic enzyme-like NAD(P)-binding protein n=1 Tax=Campylobacter sp. 19-13652 TaxID=2840180 RepID=UPI001C77CC28|nr:malic enzyme-like NAD(P)-binding protein [Campylobacter sp. 19-13652]BCX78872.1 malate dehydrogenase [Campylobacter sp. 19-13652]